MEDYDAAKGNDVRLSIVVPIYKGKQYIPGLIRCVEKCIDVSGIDSEIIFINDYPEEAINLENTEKCSVVLINNNENIGIHGSRVRGLLEAKGEYVLFLDQDDYIRSEYIRSQISKIGDADAIVCRLLNGQQEHYTESFRMEEVVTAEFMLKNWCSIVSPGQVIIKKKAIPGIWIKNIVKINGADDYFLWLSMFCSGKKIIVNHDILFEHRITGMNTSLNTNKMMDSEIEMLEILMNELEYKSFWKDFQMLGNSLRHIHIKQLDNSSMAYMVLKELFFLDYKKTVAILGRKVAIYGAADIGYAFYLILSRLGVSLFFIDRNAKYICTKIPTYDINDAPEDVDSVIIAVREQEKQIKPLVEKKYSCRVYTIADVIEKLK